MLAREPRPKPMAPTMVRKWKECMYSLDVELEVVHGLARWA